MKKKNQGKEVRHTLVQQCIENFRQQLNKCHENIVTAYESLVIKHSKNPNAEIVTFDEFFADWSQAAWELLVERIVCGANESIAIYGEGSDYEADEHSRVFFRTHLATHIIECVASHNVVDEITGEMVDITKYEFHSFVTMKDGWFVTAPPFDCVLLEERNVVGTDYRQIVVKLQHVIFIINSLQ